MDVLVSLALEPMASLASEMAMASQASEMEMASSASEMVMALRGCWKKLYT